MSPVKLKVETPVIHVLVEEEEFIRTAWLKIAQRNNYALFTYPDAKWFLDELGDKAVFRGNERFYLDQDMNGIRGVGIMLAQSIKKRWPDAFTCLVTAYPKLLFRRELADGIINDVFGKYPSPFDKPLFSKLKKRTERSVWTPRLTQLGSYP